MAAEKGSAFLLKVGNGGAPVVYSTIAGLRTTQLSVNGEAVAITVCRPSFFASWMAMVPSDSMTTDFSLDRKSSAVMCATLVFESCDRSPIECGCLRA